MTTIAIQYLEDAPYVAAIPPARARDRLRAAFEQLPITHVFLGWNVPQRLLSACREEVTRADARLFRWHPLLTGDATFTPRPEWSTIGLQCEPVPGFLGMSEFTFVCPNRPAVQGAVLEHLDQVLARGDYDGLFLDRIRYPSPADNPARWLACFCDDCHRAAFETGLDLEVVRGAIQRLLATQAGTRSFVQALLGSGNGPPSDPTLALLNAFLDFREQSVAGLVRLTAERIRAQGLAVALDCFSPVLTRMVGQNLGALDACGDWTKVMTYAHALGPAGLPFELGRLAQWLIESHQVWEGQALEWLSRASGLSLPGNRAELRARGLAPADLAVEVQRGRAAGTRNLLAGIELVEMEGIAQLDQEQIEADLRAFRAAGADGLVLSWDLWHMPLERLGLVGAVWTLI